MELLKLFRKHTSILSLFRKGQLCCLCGRKSSFSLSISLNKSGSNAAHQEVHHQRSCAQSGAEWKAVYMSVCWYYLCINSTVRHKHTNIQTNQHDGEKGGWWLSQTGLFVSVCLWDRPRPVLWNDSCGMKVTILAFLIVLFWNSHGIQIPWIMHLDIKLSHLMLFSQSAKYYFRKWLTDDNDKWYHGSVVWCRALLWCSAEKKKKEGSNINKHGSTET